MYIRRGEKIGKKVLLSLVLLLLWAAQLEAAPTTSIQAEKVVRGWLKVDRQPFKITLGRQILNIETFSDANEEPVYYIVNLQPSGFVIVSADDMIEPIVGFVPEGTYDPSTDNPLGALVSRDMPNRIAAVRRNFRVTESGYLQEEEVAEQQAEFQEVKVEAQNKWIRLENYVGTAETTSTSELAEMLEGTESVEGLPTISDIRVYPLIQSKWDQGSVCGNYCYNYYTPNHYSSGCGPTAMAQLMRFHEYPTNGIGVHGFTIEVDRVPQTLYTRGGDGYGGPYNWNQMVFEPDCDTNDAQRQAIGALCYDVGISAGVKYGIPAGVWMINVTDALRTTLLYSNAIMGGNELSNIGEGLIAMLNPNLDADYPTLLGLKIEGEDGGHAVVCDGYGFNSSTSYHHLNMGWSGSYDVWYNLPYVRQYNAVVSCVYNIFTSGSGEIISGQVFHTSGIPIAGATVTAHGNGGPYTTTTNRMGIYALANIPSGSAYTVSITKTGYQFDNQIATTGTSLDYSLTSGNCWGVDFEGSGPVPPEPNITFVNVNATGNNDGSSWSDAFTSLQQALSEVLIYTDEIRVAHGKYSPAEPSGNREATFQLINGIVIKGGYAGFGEPNPDARNIALYETILSGDLNGNDGSNFTNNNENSYHVVTASGTDGSAVLDGFTIIGGNANGSGAYNCGGGMYNDSGSPMLANCTFSNNLANGSGKGGGICNTNSSNPTITNCIFSGNVAQGSWTYGGGIYNTSSSNPSLTSCIFSDNSSGREGGGMYNRNSSSPLVTNCTFYGNSAAVNGGGICNRDGDGSNPTLTSSILWNNNDSGGTDESAQIYGSMPVINYSCIKGWTGILGGVDNIGVDPLFVNTANGDYHLKSASGRWQPSIFTNLDPTVDGFINLTDFAAFANYWQKQGIFLPADLDNSGLVNFNDLKFLLENYLMSYSPGEWVVDDVNSPCIDAGDPASDWTAELWPNGKRINMGAYGGTAEASMSPLDIGHKCDLNHDDVIDEVDFYYLFDIWLDNDVLIAEDVDRNQMLDFVDFSECANDLLWAE